LTVSLGRGFELGQIGGDLDDLLGWGGGLGLCYNFRCGCREYAAKG
jgi:hypothetical protein